MSAHLAVLTRLSRIADEAASDVARAAAVRALVDAYSHGLYVRLGIAPAHRPTARAKEDAKDALDALRLTVFRAELGADAAAARIFAVARQRIEMARRALDLRLVADEGSRSPEIGRSADGAVAKPDDDRTLIDAMRGRLRDQSAFVASREAIRQSRALLARCGVSLVRPARGA